MAASLIRRLMLVIPLLAIFLFPMVARLVAPARDWNQGLVGIPTGTEAVRPQLTLRGLWTGSYQKGVESFFESTCPGRKWFLLLYNQIDYLVFKSSYMLQREMVVGRDDQLDEIPFIRDVIQQRATSSFTVHDLMVEVLRIQGELKEHGKLMVVVTTPDKSFIYPEYIPSRFEGFDRRDPLFYSEVISELNQNHIPYVDGTGVLRRLAPTSPYRFFGRGGIHWNTYGAAQVVTPLLGEISRLTGKPVPLPSQIEAVSMPAVESQEEADTDLACHLNVIWPPLDYEVTHATIRYGEKPSGAPPRIAMAGGSFCTALREVLEQATVDDLPRVPFAKYGVDFYRDSSPNGTICRAAFENALATSDILVVELNEYVVKSTADNMVQIISELGRPENLFPLQTNVSFAQNGTAVSYIESGFSSPESKGCWTDGPRAELNIQLPPESQSYLFSAQVTPFLAGASTRQRVDVMVNGRPAGRDEFRDNKMHTLRAVFSACGSAHIEFLLPDAVSPRAAGLAGDKRALGLAFFSMRLVSRPAMP